MAEKTCPLLQKPCIEHACQWYTLVQGKHPQTHEHIDKWSCAVSWLPILIIESAQQSRQASAEVSELRKEVVNVGSEFINRLALAAGQVRKLPGG